MGKFVNIKKLVKEIERKVDGYKNQVDFVLDFYRGIFPRWDEIEVINSWPSIGKKDWGRLCKVCQKVDTRCHPDVLPGGVWMNKGPSARDNIPEGYCDVSSCEVTYKEKEVECTNTTERSGRMV